MGSAEVQPVWRKTSPEDAQPPGTRAARALTGTASGCNRSERIFLSGNLNPPKFSAFTRSPSRQFYRSNIDHVKKNLLFHTLYLPSAPFILMFPCCSLGRDIPCSPSLCHPGFGDIYPSFLLKTERPDTRWCLNTWLLYRCQTATETKVKNLKNLWKWLKRVCHPTPTLPQCLCPSYPFPLRQTDTCTEIRYLIAKQ